MNVRIPLSMCLLAGLTVLHLPAAPISGTFNMSGIVTVTANTITWQSDLIPNAADMFTLTAGAGSFATENGQNTVDNLNTPPDVVDTTGFPPTPFISFNVTPGLPVLDINFIFLGIGGAAGCSQAPAVPQTCTPPNPGGSPFTFTNEPANQSTAQFVFSGVTSDGLSNWRGVFTAGFNQPFQNVLAAFAAGGSGVVSNTFAGTVTVTSIPEPAPGFMLASGLILVLLSLGTRHLVRKQQS
jgi:hypothetical protein